MCTIYLSIKSRHFGLLDTNFECPISTKIMDSARSPFNDGICLSRNIGGIERLCNENFSEYIEGCGCNFGGIYNSGEDNPNFLN